MSAVESQGNSSPVIAEIVEQYAEEAAFLWTLRDRAVRAPNYSLRELADLDQRVEAHLDGLKLSAAAGWQLCEEGLEEAKEGEVFAAAILAFDGKDPERIRTVLKRGCAEPALERAVVSALGWLSFEQVKGIITGLVRDPEPKIRRIGIAAFAAHRQDPGPALIDALSDTDSRVKARAMEAVAELGRKDLSAYIRSPNMQPDDDCRFAAAWALAFFGYGSEALRSIALAGGAHSEQALSMAVRLMEVGAANALCLSLLITPEKRRLGIIGSGLLGDPGLIDHLIPLMQDEKSARKAGEALSIITGVDLEAEGLLGKPLENFVETPSEDPTSADVGMDPDENLPWPAPDRVKAWWQKRTANFVPGLRYFRGHEITISFLRTVLLKGTQPLRTAAALELAILEPNRPLAEVRERADRQLKRVNLDGALQWQAPGE